MFHIKLEPLREREYIPYMTSISSTSTTFPCSEIFVTQPKVEYHDRLFKLEENFERLHLNAQDDSKFFEDDILDNNKGLITKKTFLQQRLPYDKDEDEKTAFLKCKICYKPLFKSSIKFKIHANEDHHYEWLCLDCHQSDKMVESFENLHLDNVQDGSSEIFFEDKVIDEELITYEDIDNYEELPIVKQTFIRLYDKDETGRTILKCKVCYKSFKFSIKFKFHADDEVHHHYDWLCLDCCHKDNHERERDVNCILSCPRKFFDKVGLRDHCRAKHPNILPYNIPRSPLQFFPSPTFFIYEAIPNQFPSLFPQFSPYQLKCKICEEIYYTHKAFNSHARLHGYKYSCDHCSRIFRKRSYKIQHERLEHEGMEYERMEHKEQPRHIRRRRLYRLYNLKSHREANNDIRVIGPSKHPMITRSRKRKMIYDQVVLKMKNCSLNDMNVGEAEDNVFMKRIKREYAD